MRVVAILATYNEERFLRACLDHLIGQGLLVYVLDNESTDGTLAIVESFRGRGLLGLESVPRLGEYRWRAILERKEELAATLDADWFMHVDADEIRLPPRAGMSLVDAFAEADALGFNAVNFFEFTFVPTREAPDHDHARYQQTMRWYYPFLPTDPHRLNAWKRQDGRVELAWSGGHLVRFPGLRMCPTPFPMKHYLFLSVPHAVSKFVGRPYVRAEIAAGWHRARAGLRPATIVLPAESDLRPYVADDDWDTTRPRRQHFLFDEAWAAAQSPR